MYAPNVFNKRGEFQRLSGLRGRVDASQKTKVDEFLTRAMGVRILLSRAKQLYSVCSQRVERHRSRLNFDRPEVRFWSPEVPELICHVVSCLAHLRVMQNSVQEFARLAINEKRTPPPSLNDCHSRLAEFGVPEKAASVVASYWQSHGAELRDYRDVDQHYFLVARTSVYRIDLGFSLLLPDQPSRSRKQLTHGKSRDALQFVEEQYRELEAAVAAMLRILDVPLQDFPIEFSPQPALTFEDDGTEGVRAVWFIDDATLEGFGIGQGLTSEAVVTPLPRRQIQV